MAERKPTANMTHDQYRAYRRARIRPAALKGGMDTGTAVGHLLGSIDVALISLDTTMEFYAADMPEGAADRIKVAMATLSEVLSDVQGNGAV